MDRLRILGVALMVVIFCFVATGAFADGEWETSGDNINNTNTGNIGIGTDNPQSKLHVNGDIQAEGSIKANRHLTHMPWFNTALSAWSHGYLKLKTPINQYENNLFSLKIIGYRYGSGGTPVEIRCGGYAYCNTGLIQTDCHTEGTDDPVGIGVENDMVIVTIGANDADRWLSDHFTVEYFGWRKKEAEDFTWEFVTGGTPSTENLNNVYVDDSAGTITTTGNVGIGTTTPQSKLDVNGTIKAKEIKVTIASVDEVKVNDAQWSDFVFEENYKLPSLDQVESYIKENKHLPDVPSADQIAQDGLSMSGMMAKQMQKIEELTLYVIELKKQNEKLAEESTQLKARISSLEERN